MIKLRKATSKEKKEVGFILGAVFIVAVIGIIMTNLTVGKVEALSGAAVQLNPSAPTYPGVIVLLKEYCVAKTGNGDCNSICGQDVCLPAEESCSTPLSENQCVCCQIPK